MLLSPGWWEHESAVGLVKSYGAAASLNYRPFVSAHHRLWLPGEGVVAICTAFIYFSGVTKAERRDKAELMV